MSAHVRIRPDALDKIAEAKGLRSRYALAKRLGVSQSTIGRVLDGQCLPGNPFIAAAMLHLDVPFDAVFEATDEKETRKEVLA
ncbi:helix-turn-helix domain-containing protein [Actinocrispum wychmicini]|uniref:Helix-turn-helix protein n=1 Tax=Actinocrispum wychmicini TaxID=1213861 RepID=A0A4V2S8M1_9PSEU|nr:helix-turn-helix transcriptional regulator [Actinocrispum wychmicini]TCO64360.1 helix-turn-helix protein [Actinocrispum wychmicini]